MMPASWRLWFWWVLASTVGWVVGGSVGSLLARSAAAANRPHVQVLVPAEGKEAELETFLDSLPNDEVDVFHQSKAQRELNEGRANVDMILWILVTVFSVAIVMWQLWRLDPVAIIERRD